MPHTLELMYSPFDLQRYDDHPDEGYRFVALNADDYRELAQEMERFTYAGEAPTLQRVFDEAAHNVGGSDEYRGRHKELSEITIPRVQRYVWLRLLDEVLCSHPDNLLNDYEIRDEITRLARQKGLYDGKSVPLSTLRTALYPALADLVMTTVTRGKRRKNKTSIYEMSALGRRYAAPYQAFYVEISLSELNAIRQEVELIVRDFYPGSVAQFRDEFPLIGVLGYLKELGVTADGVVSFDVTNNDPLRTVNYMPRNYDGLRRHIEEMISRGVPVPAKTAGGSVELVMPRELRVLRRNWSLVAVSAATRKVRVLTPADLDMTSGEEYADIPALDVEAPEDHIVGMSPLLDSEMWRVSLTLTPKGRDTLHRRELWRMRTAEPRPDPDDFYIADFDVYLNDDLLEELLHMYRNMHLVSIRPEPLFQLFKDYCLRELGRPYIPFENRAEQGGMHIRDRRKE